MVLDQIEDALCLLRWQSSLISQLTFHLVGTEFSRCNLASLVEDSAFTLTTIVAPFSIIDRIVSSGVVTAATRTLAIDVVSDVDVARLSILHSTLHVLPV